MRLAAKVTCLLLLCVCFTYVSKATSKHPIQSCEAKCVQVYDACVNRATTAFSGCFNACKGNLACQQECSVIEGNADAACQQQDVNCQGECGL